MAVGNGGIPVAASDRFFSDPLNLLILADTSASMDAAARKAQAEAKPRAMAELDARPDGPALARLLIVRASSGFLMPLPTTEFTVTSNSAICARRSGRRSPAGHVGSADPRTLPRG